MRNEPCLICLTPARIAGDHIAGYGVECPRCGPYGLGPDVAGAIDDLSKDAEERRWVASHVIRQMNGRSGRPIVNGYVWDEIRRRAPPNPQEQADNLIIWLGSKLKSAAAGIVFRVDELGAVMGTSTENNSHEAAHYILTHLANAQLVHAAPVTPDAFIARFNCSLRFDGWARYQQLKTVVTESRRAFMAMKFGADLTDRVYRSCFVPAVAAAGFDLRRLDEAPPAGLIDNRMRAEIRSAAFLIADLTQSNAGAYWEAGFAEGVGKPVIYTCQKQALEDPTTRPHFDVNHHTTIIWDEADLKGAADQLTATIRTTLPTLAKMTDD